MDSRGLSMSMRRTPGCVCSLLAVAALLPGLAGCMEPRPLGSVKLQVVGPAYPRPRCAKGPVSLGKLYPNGEPVSGARVSLDPGGFSGTTDAAGWVTLSEVPEGTYELRVASSAHKPQAAQEITVDPGTTGASTSLRVRLTPCVSAGDDRYRVGFGKSVSLKATTGCGEAWQGAGFNWALVEGPDIRTSVSTWTKPVLTFTTASLAKVRTLPDQPTVLSFSWDQAGQYVFRVTAQSKDGVVSQNLVLVASTDLAGGVTSVPVGNRQIFLGSKKGPWKWSIQQWPSGWIRTLEDDTSRTPAVLPLAPGRLEMQKTIEIKNQPITLLFAINVGTWSMVSRDCGRADCHPALQQGWEQTRHSSTWRKLLDGELVSERAEVADSCAACHALGYDLSTDNRGYDDVATCNNVTVPLQPRKGTYAALPEDVRKVSNVYCLACHGPARVDPPVTEQRGRFGVGVCARCHDRGPEQDLVAQWRTSRMGRTVRGKLNGPESIQECARCHTAQGFYYENFALGRPPTELTTSFACCDNPEPITCQACHSPMYAANKAQVFRYGAVTTRGGLALKNIGAGALCASCHSTEHDLAASRTLGERLAPHAPQADLSYGRAGFSLPAAEGYPKLSGVACAKTAGEGCVTCHMAKGPAAGAAGYRTVGDHTFSMVSWGGLPNLDPCQACHSNMLSFNPRSRGDHDGDGRVEGVQDEVDGLMELLGKRLTWAIEARSYRGCDAAKSLGNRVAVGYRNRLVVTDSKGIDLGDCDRNGHIEREERPFLFPDADLTLHKAGYNYLLVDRDKSRGLHNLPYTIKLLQRTLYAVSGGTGLPTWELYR